MTYYLLMPGDTEQDTLNEANLIGEESFGTFWAGTALKTLIKVVEESPEILPLITIRTDKLKKSFTLEEFLTILQKLKIKS